MGLLCLPNSVGRQAGEFNGRPWAGEFNGRSRYAFASGN